MSTKVELNNELGPTIHVFSFPYGSVIEASPQDIYIAAEFLVIDDYPWQADFELLRSELVHKARKFKDPFNDRPASKAVGLEVGKLQAEADRLFSLLYPEFEVTDRQGSYRPMITQNEPIHLDTRPAAPDIPFVTSFINISRVPRVYNIGPNLHQLCAWYPKLMLEICKANADKNKRFNDVSLELRTRTLKNKPPLDQNCPKHRVELAPGSIWFMDAKTVSHEVVYGEGVVARGWTVPKSGAPQQPQILKRLK